MKRIEAQMRKKCESKKIDLRMKMVANAISSARYAAEEKLNNAEANLQLAMEELVDATNITSVLNKMNNYFNDRKDAQEELKLADELEQYLNEEIEPDPDEEKCENTK